MPAFPALLVGGGLLTFAALIMIYRASATPGRVMAMVLLSFVTSAALLAGSDFRFVHFGVNAFLHLGVISLIGAMLLRPHHRAEHHTMVGRMVLFRLILGIMFLILGVIGGFIPILQGWVFILLGLLVLFPKAKFTEKVLHKAGPKLPRTVAYLRRFGIGSHE